MMQQTTPDREDGPDETFCRTVGLMCIRHHRLMLGVFVSVERLDRVGFEFSRFIIANEFDLLAKSYLNVDDGLLNSVFSLLLGLQVETIHAYTGFIHNQKQISATVYRDFFYRAVDVGVKKLKRAVTVLVTVLGSGFCTIFPCWYQRQALNSLDLNSIFASLSISVSTICGGASMEGMYLRPK